MTDILKTLTALYGPSGNEGEVQAWILAYLREKQIDAHTDALGNIIAKVGGGGKKLVFSAHMDTVGVMLTEIDKDGYGKFTAIGWLDPASIAHTPVRFENGTVAAICIRDDKVGKELKAGDLYLDFGTGSKEETEQLVTVGDSAAFVPRFMESNHRILSTFLDNRAGCAILLQALERMEQLKNEVYYVFSVQEEVGTRGAGPAAFDIQGSIGIAVDVTAVDDVPGSIHDGTAVLGKGAGIKILDHSALCRPELISAMDRIAKAHDIPVQKDIMTGGGTDAGPMAQSGTGMTVGGISLPCRYTHAPIEVCDKNDMEACVRLVAALAETEL